MLSILFGIASSLSWGGGDFAGGLASRKVGAYRAVLYADFFGLVILAVAAIFYREALPSNNALINSLLGGMLGSFGLLILYYSLSIGLMSIAAPVSALFGGLLPVIYAGLTQGLPTGIQFAGFAFALAAVWLISQGEGGFHVSKLADLRFPIIAGVGFGGYFVFMHIAVGSQETILWPMIVSRLGGTVLIFLIVLARREALAVPRELRSVVALSATLDLGGNFFYILAMQSGRLDIAAVLSSLYPAATALLAYFLLKEKITLSQQLGIGLAMFAIVLITI